MKVFIDKNPLSGGHAVRGVGFYTKNLINSLGNTKEVELLDSPQGAEIIHYPYFDLFSHTLKIINKPTIVTIHDVIPFLYPKCYPPGIKGRINFFRQKRALKYVAQIITDSETSKKDIVRFLGVESNKVSVVYLAADDKFSKIKNKKVLEDVRRKYDLPSMFVLYVGDINYNKNLETLCKACIKAKKYLVIAGKAAQQVEEFSSFKHAELKHYKNLVECFKSKYIKRLGFVPDKDLIVLHNLADVYCQPSLYEGFGLPPLQSLACGTPVIAARTNTLVEVLGDAAEYFKPNDVGALAKLLRNDNFKTGNLPRKYSWEKTAHETFKIYKQVL